MKKVQGNDSFQRMNYLYQTNCENSFVGLCLDISKLMADKNPALSSYYGNLVINVAKKNVLKIHPDIKRQICKKCRCMLVHKATVDMKIKRKNKSKTIQLTCTICGAKKNFPANKDKDHRVWLEKPEAVIEVIN